MSLETRLLGPLGLFVEQLDGDLTLEDAQRMKRAEAALRPPGRDPRILCLVGHVTYRMEDVRRFLRWLSRETAKNSPPTACVVGEPMGAALMLLIRQQMPPRRIEVFSTLDVALNWLGLDPGLGVEDLGIDLLRPNGRWRRAWEHARRDGARAIH